MKVRLVSKFQANEDIVAFNLNLVSELAPLAGGAVDAVSEAVQMIAGRT